MKKGNQMRSNQALEILGKKLGLSASEIQALTQLITKLRASWPKAKFRLFGSKVNETADIESDLDLLIELPCSITKTIRKQIIHQIFELNLAFNTNISALIVSQSEWKKPPYSLLPIYTFIQEEGVSL